MPSGTNITDVSEEPTTSISRTEDADNISLQKSVNFYHDATRNGPKESILQVMLCIIRQDKERNVEICTQKLEISFPRNLKILNREAENGGTANSVIKVGRLVNTTSALKAAKYQPQMQQHRKPGLLSLPMRRCLAYASSWSDATINTP